MGNLFIFRVSQTLASISLVANPLVGISLSNGKPFGKPYFANTHRGVDSIFD